jgi:hypothetical protein
MVSLKAWRLDVARQGPQKKGGVRPLSALVGVVGRIVRDGMINPGKHASPGF